MADLGRLSPLRPGHARLAFLLLVGLGVVLSSCSDDDRLVEDASTEAIAVVADTGVVQLLDPETLSTLATSSATDTAVTQTHFTSSGVIQQLASGDVRWVEFAAPGNATPAAVETTLWTANPTSQVWQLATFGEAVALFTSDRRVAVSTGGARDFRIVFWDDGIGPDLIGLGGVQTNVGHLLAVARSDGTVTLMDPEDAETQTVIRQTSGKDPAETSIVRVDSDNSTLILTFDDGSIVSLDVPSGVETVLWPPPEGTYPDGDRAIDLGFAAVVLDVDGQVHVVRHQRDNSLTAQAVPLPGDRPERAISLEAGNGSRGEVIAVLASGARATLDVPQAGTRPTRVSSATPSTGGGSDITAGVITVKAEAANS